MLWEIFSYFFCSLKHFVSFSSETYLPKDLKAHKFLIILSSHLIGNNAVFLLPSLKDLYLLPYAQHLDILCSWPAEVEPRESAAISATEKQTVRWNWRFIMSPSVLKGKRPLTSVFYGLREVDSGIFKRFCSLLSRVQTNGNQLFWLSVEFKTSQRVCCLPERSPPPPQSAGHWHSMLGVVVVVVWGG